jgi:hypothetical protein
VTRDRVTSRKAGVKRTGPVVTFPAPGKVKRLQILFVFGRQ